MAVEQLSVRTAAALPAVGTRARGRAAAAVPFGLGGSVSAVAAEHGGYFPTAWGWTALGLLAFAAAGLLLRPRLRLARVELAFLAAATALTAWIGLSALWSISLAGSVAELER